MRERGKERNDLLRKCDEYTHEMDEVLEREEERWLGGGEKRKY